MIMYGIILLWIERKFRDWHSISSLISERSLQQDNTEQPHDPPAGRRWRTPTRHVFRAAASIQKKTSFFPLPSLLYFFLAPSHGYVA